MRRFWHTFVALLTLTTPATAGVPADEFISLGASPDLAAYLASVSSSEGGWTSENTFGCAGAFQFCPGTLERYYSGSKQDFLNDPKAQLDAYMKYAQDEWSKAQQNGLTSAIGHEVCYNGVCRIIDESSILKACQFGCGTGGKLDNFIRNGYSCDGPNKTSDGYGTSICQYLVSGGGYNIGDITGNQTTPQQPPTPVGGGGGGGIGQSESSGAFGSIASFTAALNRLSESVAGKIIILSQQGSAYHSIALLILTAIAVLYFAWILAAYAIGRASAAITLGRALVAGFAMALFLTYAVVVTAISWASYGIATMLQTATLGSDDAFAPMAYLIKVATNITFRDGDGAWAALSTSGSMAAAGLAVAFLFIQAAYLLAIVWATIAPLIGFFALKLVGLVAVPFMMAGKLEFIFAGWLRQLLSLAIFVVIVNAVVIANTLLVALAFNLPFSAGSVGQTAVSGLFATALIIAIMLFGIVAIFQAQRIAASWASAGASKISRTSHTITGFVSRSVTQLRAPRPAPAASTPGATTPARS
ncbi:hypothetical protein E9232_006362 [Inquilinus ginsengisoli]|uniref:Conjugal transfer protein TrbL n=1 Tax=Inquilinus ginsengisoli TaxID=363840 RepID=A0ABU1K1Z9_9PROT|nr:hypothetical protein [Inquilinus ginsengisoli]MDR6293809.1 hypothetical protein [Inquilinus ginsengisoli]